MPVLRYLEVGKSGKFGNCRQRHFLGVVAVFKLIELVFYARIAFVIKPSHIDKHIVLVFKLIEVLEYATYLFSVSHDELDCISLVVFHDRMSEELRIRVDDNLECAPTLRHSKRNGTLHKQVLKVDCLKQLWYLLAVHRDVRNADNVSKSRDDGSRNATMYAFYVCLASGYSPKVLPSVLIVDRFFRIAVYLLNAVVVEKLVRISDVPNAVLLDLPCGNVVRVHNESVSFSIRVAWEFVQSLALENEIAYSLYQVHILTSLMFLLV